MLISAVTYCETEMARRRWESAVPRMMRAAGTTRERSPTAEDQRRGASAPSHHVCVCTRILSTLLTVAYRESGAHSAGAALPTLTVHSLTADWLTRPGPGCRWPTTRSWGGGGRTQPPAPPHRLHTSRDNKRRIQRIQIIPVSDILHSCVKYLFEKPIEFIIN